MTSEYRSALDRIGGVGLDASHRWVHWTSGDCWHFEHAPVFCERCLVHPLGSVCYFELPRDGRGVERFVEAREVGIAPAALRPCPGEPS